MAKPKIESSVKNTMNSNAMKQKFREALRKAIQATSKYQQAFSNAGLRTATITGLRIDGKNLVVTFR